jgi:thymidylate synthase ThyX
MKQLDLVNFNSNPEIENPIIRYGNIAVMPPLPEGYPITAKTIADSYCLDNTFSVQRIVTLELEFPRYILAEFNTHRAFSRNASSSRAIPTKKAISAAESIVFPVRFGMNKPGMQADAENLEGHKLERAEKIWSALAEVTKAACKELTELGLHKQWASRPLEWFSTIRVVVTSTMPGFENFFLLRDHCEAQDEICYLAQAMKNALNNSTPTLKNSGQWHLPYVSQEELEQLGLNNALKVSSARCARTSYKTHHGVASSLGEDIKLFEKLVHDLGNPDSPFHASPTEHQATPANSDRINIEKLNGNFVNWAQHRKFLECNIPA